MRKWYRLLVPVAALLLSSVATAAPAPTAPASTPALVFSGSEMDSSLLTTPVLSVDAVPQPSGTIRDYLSTAEGQKEFGDEAVETFGDVGANILGCIGYSQLIYENGYTGGIAQATVLCDPQSRQYHVVITVQVQRKRLQPNSSWQNYGTLARATCDLYYGRCRAEKPFLAGDADPGYSFDYRFLSTATVDGSNGIPLPFRTDSSRPFNRSGLPYPKVRVHPRAPVEFPTYTGPWSGGSPRNDTLFHRNCDAYYASHGWTIPEPMPGDPINYHHIWPLAWGGDNDGDNCYILAYSDHLYFNAFWAGHRP